MLEKMAAFFDERLEGYEEHQLSCIEGAGEFYPFTAACLPLEPGAKVLDLGCGTGLELEYYFRRNPKARVTGIDLAPGMLAALKEKFSDRDVTLIQGSYFDVPLGEDCFDAAVSVESLHHFTQAEKTALYRKLVTALKSDGAFILTDYFALSEEEEVLYRRELERLKAQQGITDGEFYHYDTPLTVEHEIQALREAGFSSVEILNRWGATATLRAENMDWLDEARIKLKRKNQVLFSKDSEFLQDLAMLFCDQNRRVMALWAFDLAAGSVAKLEERCPDEKRPREALEAARAWAAGEIKMRLAQRKILDCHALAKELQSKEDIALCHAIGQACAVVHTVGHAMGYPMYELSAIIYRLGIDDCAQAVRQRKREYIEKLLYWSEHEHEYGGRWAAFMRK